MQDRGADQTDQDVVRVKLVDNRWRWEQCYARTSVLVALLVLPAGPACWSDCDLLACRSR